MGAGARRRESGGALGGGAIFAAIRPPRIARRAARSAAEIPIGAPLARAPTHASGRAAAKRTRARATGAIAS
ncbi:hypothetical protein BURPS305_5081 [Burkholderia pseudomallei 305]|nr:hypothetical protein BURPS305_5081 [Burkholderia pseudomallei 305]OMR20542.1 hypothetical protein AQ720_14995 [Burkholderia pseudomallei]OMS43288.1 hypothetical protein AQ742_05170 [Burkholderia pseudomallei]ONC36143.1 hypothetical protein AQ916_12705 [Burkholderia pseudomallei]